MKSTIKKFYSDLQFPGQYLPQTMRFYQDHGVHNRYLQEIDKLIEPGITVLDVGCGTGMLSNLFATRYPDVDFTALDFSDSIDYGHQYAINNGNHNVQWIKKDFLECRFTSGFDLVICCGVLHHMPDWKIAAKKLQELVKPGGALALAVYNPNGKQLKKLFNIRYHNDILYKDQECNPFETAWTFKQTLGLFADMQLISVTPSISNRFVDTLAWFNSANGGLAIYIFRSKQHEDH